ncbi:hypothetical protein AB7783_09160 [Tardiphaga sp. 172_B4_N1_3]|uniref:hypothetical protein n=1 Tax=Tardiphaga sp. 172_B4_N1_3 TaxID=3240787 RepID=UPI003F897C6A
MTIIQTTVTLLALIFVGGGGAYAAFVTFGTTAHVSKCIDLAGYLLTGVGLIGSIFYLENFQSHMRYDLSRLNSIEESSRRISEVGERLIELCPKGPPFPNDPEIVHDCVVLGRTIVAIVALDPRRFPRIPPIIDQFSSKPFIDAATEINAKIVEINSFNMKMADLEFERGLSIRSFSQFEILVLTIGGLCMAFGCGVTRRLVDVSIERQKTSK